MKVLDTHATRPRIVERCVGLAFEMGHPKRFEQLVAASRTYPDSPILKELIARDEVVAYMRQALDSQT
jgi:hypothetical protein